jgi:hypothetical protein
MSEFRRESDSALLALVENMDRGLHEMQLTHADLRQMASNISYLFGAEGPFVEMQKDLKRHNRYETGVKAIAGLGTLVGVGTLLQWGKKLFGVGH